MSFSQKYVVHDVQYDANYKFLIRKFYRMPTTSTRFSIRESRTIELFVFKELPLSFVSDVRLIFPEFILERQTTRIFIGMKAELLFINGTRDDSSRAKSERIKMSLAHAKSGSSFEETANRI